MRLIPKHYKKRMISIIAVCIFIILLLTIILCLRQCDSDETKPPSPTESDKTLDFIPAGDDDENEIRMPGYGGLIFQSGTINQKTDLYNPSVNKCLFVFSLYLSDGTLIYKSDYIKPGEKLNEITLYQSLEKGLYRNCELVIECFMDNEEKTQLNGSIQTIEIKTK